MTSSDGFEHKKPPRTGGRPEYKPTQETRGRVRDLRRQGSSAHRIAGTIGISPITLKKHFAEELKEEPLEPLTLAATEQQLDLAGEHQPAPVVVAEVHHSTEEHEPTIDTRLNVKLMKAKGWSHARIAAQVGINRGTLEKHYQLELEFGADFVQLKVMRNLWFASGRGNVSASDRLTDMPGMGEGDGDDDDPLPAAAAAAVRERGLGKKEQANRDAESAHKGTKWEKWVN